MADSSWIERILLIRRRILMGWRRFRFGLKHVDPTAYIAEFTVVRSDLKMEACGFVGRNCLIGPNVEIGRYVLVGPNVSFTGNDHRFDVAGTPMIFSGRPNQAKTIVEDDVWIGTGSVIMAGIRIGRGAIVGAGSVVTRDIPPYEIHGGVPNKKIRDRFDAKEREVHDRMLDGPVVRGRISLRKPSLQSR